MPVGGVDPYKNYRFRVEIDDISQVGFAQVLMPEASAAVIEYREGTYGLGSRKLPGCIQYENLILRWGATANRELYDWWRSIEQGRVERKNMSVVLLNDEGNELKRWNFRNTWPAAYRLSVLDAENNDVYMEEIELAHEGFELQ